MILFNYATLPFSLSALNNIFALILECIGVVLIEEPAIHSFLLFNLNENIIQLVKAIYPSS